MERARLAMVIAIVAMLAIASVPAQAETITIAVQAGAPEPAVYKEFSKEFVEKTGIQIEWIDIPQEQQRNKLFVELTSGSGTYDVVALDHPWVAEFAEAGLIDSLDDFIAEDKDDFLSAPMQSMSYNGSVYGVPQYAVVVLMYYRTDLFDEYDLTPPTVDNPLTWEGFLNAAERLTIDENDDGKPEVYGTLVMGKRHPVPALGYMDWMKQAGGSVFGEDGSVTIDEAPAVEALQFMLDMVYKYKVAPLGAASFDHVDNHTQFMQGRLAMSINWQYAYSLFKDPSQSNVVGKFAISAAPKGKVSTSATGSWGLAIPTASAHKEAAKKWIEFITSTEQLYNLRKQSFGPAVRYSELEMLQSDETLSDEAIRDLNIMTEVLNRGYVVPKIPEWPQVQDIMAEAISAAMSRDKTPSKALADAAVEIEKMLE